MEKKIGFIGTGNIATTIIDGLISHFDGINQRIYVSNRGAQKGMAVAETYGVNYASNNIELVKCCDVIFLGVKPDVCPKVLKEISSYVDERKVLISVIAGVSLEEMQQYFSSPKKIIRTMPNVAVNVREGMIALCPSPLVTEEELEFAKTLFSSIGRADKVEEALLDTVTCISGCSPAFVALFVEAMADAAVLQGMPRDKAYQYAAQTLVGTGKLILEKKIHPGALKDMVTSPGGITIEGVYLLEKRNFRSTVMDALEACYHKIKDMTKK